MALFFCWYVCRLNAENDLFTFQCDENGMVNVHIYLFVVQGATTMSIDLTFCHEDSFCICLKTPTFEFTCLT